VPLVPPRDRTESAREGGAFVITGNAREALERLAKEVHTTPARALRVALREQPDGSDQSLRRQRDVLSAEVLELQNALIDVAHDLFELVGAEATAAAINGNRVELVSVLEAARSSERICRGCGCTECNACPGGCSWASPGSDLCTRCAARRHPKARRA
jgi:hypothetical protein